MAAQIVEDVVRRLADAKGRWRRVSEVSEVPYDTLTKIAQGKTKNPRVETITRIDIALDEMAIAMAPAKTKSNGSASPEPPKVTL